MRCQEARCSSPRAYAGSPRPHPLPSSTRARGAGPQRSLARAHGIFRAPLRVLTTIARNSM